MFHLLVDMLERVGFLIALAFVFSRSRWMRGYMSYGGDGNSPWRFVLFFSLYAVLGTYSGVAVTDYSYRPAPWIGDISGASAIANSRTVGVVIAGLLGGPWIGLLVGGIAGLHRYSLGGFVAVACMIAPLLQGLLAGLCRGALRKRLRRASSSAVRLAFLAGLLAELLQMALILLLVRPWHDTLSLVSLIIGPQTAANSIGVALFFVLYQTIESEEDRIGTEHARKALHIADLTMPLWRLPFEQAVVEAARTLNQETKAVGVSFCQGSEERAHEGRKTAHYIDLPLELQNKKRLGAFRLYYERSREDSPSRRRMLQTLAGLLSQQYAFVEAERQAQLLADAEIRSLQAQMSPHFLFNVLNTVKSYIRTKPDEARGLVMHLSRFLRTNLNNSSRTLVTIREEMSLVTSYLSLTQARLGDQLQLVTEIDERVLERLIPPFTIQPLVENAILHGTRNSGRPGLIRIGIREASSGGGRSIEVTVEDNGSGMDTGVSRTGREEHAGIALENIAQRLGYHYGTEKPLEIRSEPGRGTRIAFRIPWDESKRGDRTWSKEAQGQ
ncbi:MULTISPECIES: LytS/YhcK type 5TM receptor domain-containing protein [Paenibacillus]|uniref:LytS/YhcK type 5TM receptor domain-containing protein n=1 Tax=Paenibacillus TaxID=44249 RepID=UPI0022B8DE40|nr:LytS/YhcK type 5TM receptor domain-containing protein [Paenibacillus caseinilyticus]MCZ8519280.1 histidine kinase [Paenibacillus caseinilyticus]